MSALLGHKNSKQMELIEKGERKISIDEAFAIAHILDVDIEAIRLKKHADLMPEVQERAIKLAQKLANKAYQNRFKKRLLWLTQLITRKKD